MVAPDAYIEKVKRIKETIKSSQESELDDPSLSKRGQNNMERIRDGNEDMKTEQSEFWRKKKHI